jgi:DNA-binding CsgD family transcriptional regulator
VCARIADGQEYREIAAELGISPSTVIDHVRRIHRRLGVRNRAKLVALLEQAAAGGAVSE